VDLVHAPWNSPGWGRGPPDLRALEAPGEDAGVREDAEYWCTTAGDEERGRARMGRRKRIDKFFF